MILLNLLSAKIALSVRFFYPPICPSVRPSVHPINIMGVEPGMRQITPLIELALGRTRKQVIQGLCLGVILGAFPCDCTLSQALQPQPLLAGGGGGGVHSHHRGWSNDSIFSLEKWILNFLDILGLCSCTEMTTAEVYWSRHRNHTCYLS